MQRKGVVSTLHPLVRDVDERSVEKVLDEMVRTCWSTNAQQAAQSRLLCPMFVDLMPLDERRIDYTTSA